MGVGAGIFKMINNLTKAVNSANLKEQEICLAAAYAQSASHDSLIAADFEAAMADGLMEEQIGNSLHSCERVKPLN